MSKVKVLFLAANPNNTSLLRLDEEMRAITEKIRASEYRESIELISVWAVRGDDLLQALNTHKPEIVHFSGHSSQGGEILVADSNGSPKPLEPQAIKSLFTALKDNIRVVLLNTCNSQVQAEVIAEVIDCVIGMNSDIGDLAAIVFAASFYRAIGFGRSVQEAFAQGKTALWLEGLPEVDTPKLFFNAGIDPSRHSSLILSDVEATTKSFTEFGSMSTEYYFYVSQTKVNMLFEQISEIGSDQSRDYSIYRKLKFIKDYLAEHKKICLLKYFPDGKEKQYVIDTGAWVACLIGKTYDNRFFRTPGNPNPEDSFAELSAKDRPAPVSYLLFCSRPGVMVFLIGSPKHLTGYQGVRNSEYTIISRSFSIDEYIMSMKENGESSRGREANNVLSETFRLMASLWDVPSKDLKVLFVVYNKYEVTDNLWDEIGESFTRYNLPIPDKPKIVLLGSPIFVALPN